MYSDNKAKSYIIGNTIWVSIDESTDVNGIYVANVLIRTLRTDQSEKSYFLKTEVLDIPNDSINQYPFICCMVFVMMTFISDSTPYMVLADTAIKAFKYSKMIHLTCFCNGMHRAANDMRGKFPEIVITHT